MPMQKLPEKFFAYGNLKARKCIRGECSRKIQKLQPPNQANVVLSHEWGKFNPVLSISGNHSLSQSSGL
jgi:hypothetical protein